MGDTHFVGAGIDLALRVNGCMRRLRPPYFSGDGARGARAASPRPYRPTSGTVRRVESIGTLVNAAAVEGEVAFSMGVATIALLFL